MNDLNDKLLDLNLKEQKLTEEIIANNNQIISLLDQFLVDWDKPADKFGLPIIEKEYDEYRDDQLSREI